MLICAKSLVKASQWAVTASTMMKRLLMLKMRILTMSLWCKLDVTEKQLLTLPPKMICLNQALKLSLEVKITSLRSIAMTSCFTSTKRCTSLLPSCQDRKRKQIWIKSCCLWQGLLLTIKTMKDCLFYSLRSLFSSWFNLWASSLVTKNSTASFTSLCEKATIVSRVKYLHQVMACLKLMITKDTSSTVMCTLWSATTCARRRLWPNQLVLACNIKCSQKWHLTSYCALSRC